VELFRHGNADVGVEDVGGEAVAVESEVAGDGSVGDADAGAGFAGDVEGGLGFAEGGVREIRCFRLEEVGAGDLEGAAGDGSVGGEGVEVGGFGVYGVKQGQGVRVCGWGWGCKWGGAVLVLRRAG